jgi:hypothetical protein
MQTIQTIRSHTLLRHGTTRVAVIRALALALALLAAVGCVRVRASQRERLASPAMQFDMDPVASGQRDSILEITEGGTFPSAGPGTAGAGCGCN